MSNSSKKTGFLVLSIALYVIALFLPSAEISDFERGIPEIHSGFDLLTMGWMGILALQFSWLANPFYMLALVTYGSKSSSTWNTAALVFVLCSFLPSKYPVNYLLPGYYLWLASVLSLMWGNSLHRPE